MKVLIISHNPISTQNNMGKTFLSLFSCFAPEELCQLYIYPTVPNSKRCSSYYRVTDKEVLGSLVKFRSPGGELATEKIEESHGMYEDQRDEAVYRNRKNKSPLRRLLRDAMWQISPWYSKKLTAWLEKEQPQCIFLAPGPAKFIYDIALKISAKRQIPIVTYICDEYYFVQPPKSPGEKLRLGLLQGKIEALMGKSAALVVICDALKQAYSEKFGVHAETLMTGTSYPFPERVNTKENPQTISYFGNIRCNRYRSLADVGGALDSLNQKLGTSYRLRIYTAEKDPQILETFSDIPSVELCGFVAGEEFDRAFHASDLLLHVEAFDEESMDAVKHSVSTKVADSLASGIPLLAYGPQNVASMAHLRQNNCALTAVNPTELEGMLLQAFTDGNARQKSAERALAVARQCHDSEQNSQRLYALLEAL